MNRQLVANNDINQHTRMRGFIDFGQDAASQVGAIGSPVAVAIGLHHFIERVSMAGSVQQQQAFDRTAGAAQHGNLVGNGAIALAHSHRVNQHHMLVMQTCEHQFQIGRVLDSMNRHTQYLAIDPQLLKGPDTVAVGGDQRQFFRPETHDAARCQFGRGGGFAHPGRTHQCIDAALIHQGVFILQHGHLPCHGRFDVLQAAGMVLAGGQIFQQVFGQARTESGAQQGTQQLPAQRIAPLRFVPHEAGELLFNHASHGMNFT